MKKEQGGIVDRRGNGIGAVVVTVYNTGTQVKPTIYSDNGITPQANPFNTDAYGRWSFYIANGRYDIEFSGAMVSTYLMVDVLIEEAGTGTDASSIQGHDVNEAALGNDKVLVYKVAGDEFVYEAKGTPDVHKTSHENGGGDEISVAGLSGLLGDSQTPLAHKTSHENGGGDEISVDGLSGLLATLQIPVAHSIIHENGGGDEISVAGLSGLLGDSQTPLAHKTSHENGGGDEISVAGLSGQLGDKQDADKIQGHAVDEGAVGNDKILTYKTAGDKFVYESKTTPGAHAASHQDGGGDEISVAGLSGQLGDKQDASKIQGHIVDEAAVGDDKILVYKTSGDKFIYEAKGTPSAHAASHQDGGGDKISVAGLSGVLADKQDADHIQGHIVDEAAVADDKILVYKISGDKFIYENKGTPSAHKTSHEDGGGDEISVIGLSGLLADDQHVLDSEVLAIAVGPATTNTLTNKRITSRITTIVSNANPTIDTDNCDAVTITAQSTAIASMTTNLTGTPTNFQKLIIRIKDDGTARAIAWGAKFVAKGVTLPTTTVLSKLLTVGFIYDSVLTTWGCVASVSEV